MDMIRSSTVAYSLLMIVMRLSSEFDGSVDTFAGN